MRAIALVLALIATPDLADVAGTASMIDGDSLEYTANGSACMGSTRPRAGSYAAWTITQPDVWKFCFVVDSHSRVYKSLPFANSVRRGPVGIELTPVTLSPSICRLVS